MTRRALKFPSFEEGAASRGTEGTHGDRKQHITDFFKPTCKPDDLCSALKNFIGNKDLKLQTQDINSYDFNKIPPLKRRRKSPAQSPSKRPIIEALLKRDNQTIVNGSSVSNRETSNVKTTLESEEASSSDLESEFPLLPMRPATSESKNSDCSTSNSPFNGSKKVLQRIHRDSVDSDESFHALSLSTDEEEEETLKPLDEIIKITAEPVPATPQGADLSLLSLSQSPIHDTPANNRLKELLQTPFYDNNLECLVKEKEESERIDAIEKQLHKDLERGQGVADEKVMDSEQDGELTDEHRDLLKKFSVVTNAIPDHHPGEEIFHLPESGKIFNIRTLNLQHLQFNSGGNSEEMIIFSCSPGNQLMLATEGFLTTLYQFKKCPEVLMRWMFQMVSIHPSYATSIKLLNALIEMTCNHLTNLEEKPWVPTLLDIATVFANMGIAFKTLFSLLHIQPSFKDFDLVSAVPGSVSTEKGTLCTEQIFSRVPASQIAHVIKFLGLCTAVYRESYEDLEILALLVMLLKNASGERTKGHSCDGLALSHCKSPSKHQDMGNYDAGTVLCYERTFQSSS
ncbi:unnamed protein product [Staurois parvus]|uniref:Coiled-coil SMC6 And NSE5 INteracting (CANIN) domain-containing protein n=1 Tax=Staurois parvus TaxID=386267 RepID=A0ABN9HHQ7_9NEOB|nr:unnamed protein product [Staurois parvus]